MAPPCDVRLILKRNANRHPVHRHRAGFCVVEYRLVVVVEEPPAGDRLEVPNRIVPDADGFDPDNVVLKKKQWAHYLSDVLGNPRVGTGAAYIKEEGCVRPHNTLNLSSDVGQPTEIGFPRLSIIIGFVCHANIIWRRGNNNVDRFGWEATKHVQTVPQENSMRPKVPDRARATWRACPVSSERWFLKVFLQHDSIPPTI